MGIHGLTGFIDNNQHLLHQHQLHDSCVVLDGNNFYHFLYYACHVQCSFGGDYDVYRRKIISTFQSFQACGITPYVVMDGAYTVDGRKLKTSLARASARIRLVDTMANNQKGQALPALAYETFMQTLTEIGVPHATCQFEADNEIAVLANKMNCPVISNDSDFYIFDLSNGFLPLDYLDFRPLEKQNPDGTKSYTYLHCHKYHVNDFINSFDGLNRSVLPVFASLLGNDFIDVSAFSTFYSRVKVPKVVSKKFSLPPRLSKVISVLHWLHSQHDSANFCDIKDEILGFIKPGKKDKVEKMFVSSVNGYADVDNFQGFDLYHFFTANSEKCWLIAAEDFCGYNGTAFPEWFVRAVCKGEITPSILNCAILHRVIILTQVEDLSLPTSHSCSIDLRQVLYGILLKNDQPGRRDKLPNDASSSNNTASQAKLHAPSDNTGSFKEREDEDITTVSMEDRLCFGKEAACHDELMEDVHHRNGQISSEMKNQDQSLEGHGKQLQHFISTSEEKQEACGAEDATEEKKTDDEDEGDTEVDLVEKEEEVEVEEEGKHLKAGGGHVSMKEICIEEYTRDNKNLRKAFVEPQYNIGCLSFPGLKELSSTSLEHRQLVLLGALHVDQSFIGNLSGDLQLFVSCLTLWVRQANPRVTLNHLETVIVGVILLRTLMSLTMRKDEIKKGGDVDACSAQFPDVNVVSEAHDLESGAECSNIVDETSSILVKDEINIDRVCLEASTHHLEHLRQSLDKYYKKSPSFNRKHHYNPRISHAFAQLQACILDAINLNKLLKFPLPQCCPAEFINGTFLYNFQTELQVRPNPELFLITMLGKNSPLHIVFERLKSLVVNTVGQDCFMVHTNFSKKSRKRKSKGQENGAKSTQPSAISCHDETERSTIETVPGFDIANKFSLLCMED